jgi:hypothetical protein
METEVKPLIAPDSTRSKKFELDELTLEPLEKW